MRKEAFFIAESTRTRLKKEEMAEDAIELKELRSKEKKAISFDDHLKKRKISTK